MPQKETTYHPLTHPQKRIYYIDKLNTGTSLHNIGGSLNIPTPIDIEIMKKAINLIIKNNEGLRLRFTEINEQPMQYVSEFEEQDIPFHDFTTQSNPKEAYTKWGKSTFTKSFSLADEQLFHFAIYKLSRAAYGVLLKIHHIISDGWSIALIQRQACELYNQLAQEQALIQTENHTYISFIESEEKYLTSKRFTKNKTFWLEKLQNPPSEFLYNSSVSVKGARSSLEIDTHLSNQIKDFTTKKNCSLNTFFTAVLLIYIYKTTNERDIIMGTSVFNRTSRVQRNMIGMFTSTMPLRFSPDPQLNTEALITQLDQEIQACFLNQKYPYDLIIQDLELSKSGYDSLFRMTINYYNMDMSQKINNTITTNNEHYNGNQSYSMQLIVKEWTEKNIELDFDYKTAEYTEAEIKTMQQAITHIACQLTNEKLLIKDIQLAHNDEINDYLHHFNATKNHYPGQTVTQLFEAQAAKNPDRIALEFENHTLTYKALNEKSNQVANYLQIKGVDNTSIIGILQTHSPELIISILAILKAGGTYLPIDPDYPVGRTDYLLKNSKSDFLLTNVETESLTFTGEIINIHNLDLSTYSPQNPTNKTSLNDLAYIIYTSGSTGAPKGVMVKHQGLTNYIYWAAKTYFKTDTEAMALYSSIAFDLTVTTIFTPLITGAKIIIYDSDDTEFVLYKILRENKTTVLKLTPAHLDLLKGNVYQDSKVKTLIIGGDDLKVGLAKDITHAFGDIEIYNEYGPTETVVGCMIHQYHEESDTSLSVPIGKPIDNTQIYILNEDLNVMPVGLSGELYISGAGVAHGYLNNAELTGEKFIENPFVTGKTMYKTGDMAKYLENGSIEYIGRADNQVKIRGHRIELGEIERCLTQIPAVKNVAVILKESLNAYIVAAGISEKELKQKLSETLPHYMVPTNFIFMDQLPLTLNGKIDISALPEPDTREVKFEAAHTLTEKALISAISEVLGNDNIGMNDNFYQLGGDSIKAIQISARLLNVGYVVKAKDILKFETVGEIASIITMSEEEIDQGMAFGELVLTPITKWFFEQNFVNKNHYNQSIVLKINEFERDKVQEALTKLIHHHDALRLNYNQAQEKLYYNNQGSDVSVDYFDLSTHSSDEQDRLVEELGFKLKAGLDIQKGLLFKAGAFNLGERGHLLLLNAHHLVVDGVSWRIILEDLDHLLSGETLLPLKTHSFMEWSHWLNQYSKNSFDIEKAYWKEVLAQPFYYPVEFDKGPDTIGMSTTMSIELESGKTEKLSVVGDVYNIGVHETLTIALSTVIKELTSEREVVIELEGHGREEMDSGLNISRTVGWFTSLYPIRLRIADEDLDFNIKSLKEQLRKVPNKGFDFGVLKYLKGEFTEQGGQCIRFNYLGNDDSNMKRNSFQVADVGYEFDTDQHNLLTAILDINALIVDAKLIITITFSRNKFSEERMRNFLNMYLERINDIISLASLEPNKKFTPSDFSASDISQDDLDSLFG